VYGLLFMHASAIGLQVLRNPLVNNALAIALAWFGFGGAAVARGLPQATEKIQLTAYVPSAVADLDGDLQPDVATVRVEGIGPVITQYRIELKLSAGLSGAIAVNAPFGGLLVTPRDVDGDNDLDLIVTTRRLHLPVGIWINNGRGQFSAANPAAYPKTIWDPLPEWIRVPTPHADFAVLVRTQAETAVCGAGSELALPIQAPGWIARASCSPPFSAIHLQQPARAPPTRPERVLSTI
jgi:hypothetical protein